MRSVSLDVESGSLHAVVGPSGCGKSTLLYILGLLDKPDAGSLQIGATPITHLNDEELARRLNALIGFIFQFYFLMEDFTAQENVMIPILADEPTGNLDTRNSQRAFQLLANIVRKRAKALLLVTHNRFIADACDWVHEMKDGRIIASHPRGERISV